MGLLQWGFEITRLAEDTNLATPMFPNKMGNNNMTNTHGFNAGLRVGIGSKIYQVSSGVLSDPFTLYSTLCGIYLVAATGVACTLVRSTLTTRPAPANPRHILAVAGVAMGSAFVAAMLPGIMDWKHSS